MDKFGKMGLIGLSVFLALNAYAFFVLEKPSAQPFSGSWWSEWFPAGVVWLAFLAIAGIRLIYQRSSARRGAAA